MFGGSDDEGPGAGLFANLAAGMPGPAWTGRRGIARGYDEYLKAYSVAMLPGRPRDNLSYGGKIVMPPSALANLSALELDTPWTFQLRNPSNPAASTHAGVLEFIAEEGVVHLPFWMMKTLRLNEGDPIRITNATLPKGKRVKLQAQTVDFLEVSDPKAVLEHALRNFTTLTQGDIIEIIYNMITFEILIMEILPEGPGISVFETDLEVDFAAPKGYVEPARPAKPPPPTMASKLKIDLNSTSPGSSRPSSVQGGPPPGQSSDWESFKGKGETLNGRKTKGKGKSVRKIEEVDKDSWIIRTDKQRMMTTDDLDSDVKVPTALNLPLGHLFFGYQVVPYQPPEVPSSPTNQGPQAFSGAGNTLSGRGSRNTPTPSATAKGKQKAKDDDAKWGQGQTLGGRRKGPPSDAEVIDVDSD